MAEGQGALRPHTRPPTFPAGCNGAPWPLWGPILLLVQSLKLCKALGADPAPARLRPLAEALWVQANPGSRPQGVAAGAETPSSTPQGC